MRRFAFFLGTLLVVACVGGGGHYYVVRDLSGGRIYYTSDLEKLDNGYVKLTDAKTHEEVTIPNHAVQEITKAEYNALVNGPGKYGASRKSARRRRSLSPASSRGRPTHSWRASAS